MTLVKVSTQFRFALVVILIFALRITDLLITYEYTPDLAHELNPVVSIFGADWSVFLIVQASLFLFIVGLTYFYFFHEPVKVEQKGLSFTDFIYSYFHGSLHSSRKRIALFPKNIRRHLVFNGFFFMTLAICESIFAIIHNLLIVNYNYIYIEIMTAYHKPIFALLGILFIVSASFYFFAKEFRRYKKCTRNLFNWILICLLSNIKVDNLIFWKHIRPL